MAFLKFLIASVIVAAVWAFETPCEPQQTTVAAGQGYEWANCNMGGASEPRRLFDHIKVSPTGDYNLGVGMCLDMCECTTNCSGILYHAGQHWCSGYGPDAGCTATDPANSGACYAKFMRTAGPAAPTDANMGSCIMKTRRTADENGYAKLASVSDYMLSCQATSSGIEVSGRRRSRDGENYNDNNANAQQCEAKCETLPGCQVFIHFTPNATENAGRCHYYGEMCRLSLASSCNEPSRICFVTGYETYLRVAGPSEATLAPTPSPTTSGGDENNGGGDENTGGGNDPDGSGTTTTTSPAPTPVTGRLVVAVSNTSAILGDSVAKLAFENGLAVEIAQAAGNGVTAADVTVTVSASASGQGRRLSGGLLVEYSVDVPASATAAAVSDTINTKTVAELTTSVNTVFSTIPALEDLEATGVTIETQAGAQTTTQAPAPAPAPAQEISASDCRRDAVVGVSFLVAIISSFWVI